MKTKYIICPNCDFFVDEKVKTNFCPNCGSKMVDHCPECRKKISDPYIKFCTECGNKLKTGVKVIFTREER
jgi:predicted RNA-binding Zn-ribbon protein involved in translation (DUF1610 family)